MPSEQETQEHGTSLIAALFSSLAALMFTLALVLLLLGLDGYGLRAAVIAFGLVALAVVVQKALEWAFDPPAKGDYSE